MQKCCPSKWLKFHFHLQNITRITDKDTNDVDYIKMCWSSVHFILYLAWWHNKIECNLPNINKDMGKAVNISWTVFIFLLITITREIKKNIYKWANTRYLGNLIMKEYGGSLFGTLTFIVTKQFTVHNWKTHSSLPQIVLWF